MKKYSVYLFLTFWYLIPLLFFLGFLNWGLKVNTTELKQTLDKNQIWQRNSNDLLEELPNYLEQYPQIAAIFITTGEGILLGSMYQPQRISEKDYRYYVEQLRQRKISTKDLFSKHQFFVSFSYEIANRYGIYFLLRPKISFSEFWQYKKEKYPTLIVFILSYFVLGLILALLFFVFNKKKKSHLSFSLRPKEKEISQKITNSATIRPLQFEKQIHYLLNQLQQLCPFAEASFYIFERNQWQALLHRQGQLIIRGEILPQVPDILLQLSQRELWSNPVCNATKDEVIFPLRRRQELLGALYLQASNILPFKEEKLNQAMQEVALFAREFHTQRSFEAAALDEDTGFFTKPLFTLTLKEKILTNKIFASAVFEIPEIERIAPQTLLRWARAVLRQISFPNYTIARLDRSKIGIIFEMAQAQQAETLTKILTMSKEIQKLTQKIMGLKLYGVIVPSFGDLASLEQYLRRLEQALLESKKSYEVLLINPKVPHAVL